MKIIKYFVCFLLLLLFKQGYSLNLGLPDQECSELWKNNHLKKESYLFNSASADPDKPSNYKKFYETSMRAKCYKEWTVLIDMNGDDPVLSANALMDIYDLESIGSSISVDVLVQINTKDDTGIRRTHIFRSSEKWDKNKSKKYFENYSPSKIKSPVIKILPEKAFLETNLFEDFLNWGMQRYPSKHYMVVYWGHGEGWTNSNSFDTPGGIGINPDTKYKLTIPDLKKSLKKGGRVFNFTIN